MKFFLDMIWYFLLFFFIAIALALIIPKIL